MQLAVNPNRMELMRLRRRHQLAKRGHKLLKDKQEELLRSFLATLREARTLRTQSESAYREVEAHHLRARLEVGETTTRAALAQAGLDTVVTAESEQVMNLRVPALHVESGAAAPAFGYDEAPAELDAALLRLGEILPTLLRLLSKEAALRSLAAELERTRRRVNALEHVLIPALDQAIRYVSEKLDEDDRATATRLMKIKDIVQAR